MKTKTRNLKAVKLALLSLICALGLAMVVGCGAQSATPEENGGNEGNGNGSAAVSAAVVEGTITEISAEELLMNATSDTGGSLQGAVRVGFTEIDEDVVKSLNVGDTIKVEYPGIMGMSEPPFISANSIEVVSPAAS